MLDEIWDYLNLWIRKKLKETFTTDGLGNTAIRVSGDINASFEGPNQEEIINSTLITEDTEYEIVLPTNVKRYTIHCRSSKLLKLAYNLGETTTNYLTIYPGATHDSSDVDYVSAKSIYLKSSSSNISVEIKVQRRV